MNGTYCLEYIGDCTWYNEGLYFDWLGDQRPYSITFVVGFDPGSGEGYLECTFNIDGDALTFWEKFVGDPLVNCNEDVFEGEFATNAPRGGWEAATLVSEWYSGVCRTCCDKGSSDSFTVTITDSDDCAVLVGKTMTLLYDPFNSTVDQNVWVSNEPNDLCGGVPNVQVIARLYCDFSEELFGITVHVIWEDGIINPLCALFTTSDTGVTGSVRSTTCDPFMLEATLVSDTGNPSCNACCAGGVTPRWIDLVITS